MPSDILNICNRALLAVGARTYISSVNPSDGSVEADACSTLFTSTFEQLGRAAMWNCLTRQITLSLLQAATGTPENPAGTSYPLPPTPWLYAYTYPSDSLDIRFIVPSFPSDVGSSIPQTTVNNSAGSWIPSAGQIPYAVSTVLDNNNAPLTVILTNQDLAQAVYTVNQPNPAGWDSLFQEAMVASLGAFLVPALSLSLPLMDRCVKIAEVAIARARAADGNEGVTAMDHTPDWFIARSGGQGFNNFSSYGGYCNVLWPNSGSYGY